MGVTRLFTFFAALTLSVGAHAGLVGQVVTANGLNLTPASATIGDGVEFHGLSYTTENYLAFDFADDTLTLSLVIYPNAGLQWFKFDPYVFSGFTSHITDMYVLSNEGFTGTLLSGFSVVNNQISIDFADGTACCGTEAKLVYKIVTDDATVPEPATGLLMLVGLGLLAGSRSRRTGSQSCSV